jgi:hypothetical protein
MTPTTWSQDGSGYGLRSITIPSLRMTPMDAWLACSVVHRGGSRADVHTHPHVAVAMLWQRRSCRRHRLRSSAPSDVALPDHSQVRHSHRGCSCRAADLLPAATSRVVACLSRVHRGMRARSCGGWEAAMPPVSPAIPGLCWPGHVGVFWWANVWVTCGSGQCGASTRRS